VSDAEYRALKRSIKRVHDRWLRIMHLESWDMLLIFHRDDYPIPQEPGGSNVGSMYIDADWRYLLATIHINMPALLGLSDERIEQNIVHEFTHCLVSEMHRSDPESRDHEERVVTMLTLALNRAYDTGWNDGKADLRRKQREAAKETKAAQAAKE